jgi:restriction endonuclease S subunit
MKVNLKKIWGGVKMEEAIVKLAVFKNLTTDQIKKFKIPLPSFGIQKQIVAQIEEEQKLVQANKKLIAVFEQKIKDKIKEVWGEL